MNFKSINMKLLSMKEEIALKVFCARIKEVNLFHDGRKRYIDQEINLAFEIADMFIENIEKQNKI